MRTLYLLLVLVVAAPAWSAPAPKRVAKTLVFDLSKAKVADLAQHRDVTALTLTEPYDRGW